MRINKILNILTSTLLVFGITANAQITNLSISTGTLDREFDINKTLYYVSLPNNTQIPVVTANGGTIVRSATDLTNNNLTVVRDEETGKLYRLIFNVESNDIVVQKCTMSASGLLTIKGQFNTDVNLMILKTKVLKGDDAYNTNEIVYDTPENSIYDVVTIPAGSENYTYQFSSSAQSGTYRFVFGAVNVPENKQYSTTIYYASESDLANCLTDVNALTTPAQLNDYLLLNYRILQMDKALYLSILDRSIYNSMLIGKNFQGMDQVMTAYNTATAISVLNQTEKQNLMTVFNTYDDYYLINMNGVIKQVDNTSKIINMLYGKAYSTVDEVKKYFDEAVAVQYINEAEPSEILDRFTSQISSLMISENSAAQFNDLSSANKAILLGALQNKDFSSGEDLRIAFERKLNDILYPQPSNSPRPSNTSGGGGSFTVGTKNTTEPEVPVVTTEPDNEIPKEPEKKIEFKDLEDVKWANEAILYLSDIGVINGKDENTFAPNDFVTREEFVKMLVLATDATADNATNSFTDVDQNAWYNDVISIAVAKKITSGISQTEFGVGSNITRQDMAVMVSKAAAAAGIKLLESVNPVGAGIKVSYYDNDLGFNDADSIADYAKAAVSELASSGIVKGVGDSMFEPNQPVTRAMAAQVIYNLIKNV